MRTAESIPEKSRIDFDAGIESGIKRGDMDLSRLKRIAAELRAEIQRSAQGEDIDPAASDATERSFFRVTQLSKLEAAEEIIRGVLAKAPPWTAPGGGIGDSERTPAR